MTSSTTSGATPVRPSSPFSAVTPSSTAVSEANIPPYRPIGVRTGSQITAVRMLNLSPKRTNGRESASKSRHFVDLGADGGDSHEPPAGYFEGGSGHVRRQVRRQEQRHIGH